MLQNRVDPTGTFITTAARGAWMGNRGVIHHDKKITRPFRHKAWITCALAFKGRKRTVMTPGRWTELFFLDEATAFAAGHRPCFECRRDAAQKFKSAWLAGNPAYGFTMKTPIGRIDDIIHRERIDAAMRQVTHQRSMNDLPPGTFVLADDQPHVVMDSHLLRWTPFGYDQRVPMTVLRGVVVTALTPNSIIHAFRAGYSPQVAG